jgi:hypothetical protein
MKHDEFMRSVQVTMLSHFNWWADRKALTGAGMRLFQKCGLAAIHPRDKKFHEGFAETETFAGSGKVFNR